MQVASLPTPDEYLSNLPAISQSMMDWLLRKGVHPLAVSSAENSPIRVARGHCAPDGWFDMDESGDPHFGILVEDRAGPIDVAFWHARSGRTATLHNYGFALGEHLIENPGVYSHDHHLNIFANPLDWLRSDRDGIFILNWNPVFDRLGDCPDIAVDESLLAKYRTAMQPPHMPNLFVMTDSEEAVA
jgi:hypothetical protein